jgi:hypothetical protein
VSLRQPLFSLQRYFQYEQAKDQVADAEATHQRDLQELIVRVGGAYMEALFRRPAEVGVGAKAAVHRLIGCHAKGPEGWHGHSY